MKVKSLSHVRLLATPRTAAYQAPPSMGFSRQEHWNGVPLPSLGRAIALTIWTFVGKVTSLLYNMLSRLVIDFLPRNKHLLIPWLQLPCAVILEPKKINYFTSHIRRRQWHPTPVLLPGKSYRGRSLVGCSPWGR